MEQFLLFGLGNPGRDYARTRHNIGFLVIDRLASYWNINLTRYKFKSLIGEHRAFDYKAMLIKPQTYMNKSGFAVRQFTSFYKPEPSRIMVIFDDLDLPFGTIRIRQSGGSSGHKGMNSIIQQLGTEEFPRMRVGIGRPPGKMDSVDYVLNEFKPSDKEDLDFVLNHCVDAIQEFIQDGIEKAMTHFNSNILEGEN